MAIEKRKQILLKGTRSTLETNEGVGRLGKLISWLIFFLVYLFLTVLGIHCCARAFSSCGERGLPFVVVCRLLIAVASLVVEHGL